MKRALLALAAVACTAACSAEEPRILSVDLLRDTRDTRGPYEVAIIVRGVGGGDRIEVRWTSGAGDGDTVWLPAQAEARIEDRDDLLFAAIPGQRAGTTVQYYVAVVRDGRVLSTDPPGALGLAGSFSDAPVPLMPDGGPVDATSIPDGPIIIDAGAPSPKPRGEGARGDPAGFAGRGGAAEGGARRIDGEDASPGSPDAGAPATVYAFRVLSPSGACRADTDCASGVEICDVETCRPFEGTCADGACPDGYACDATREPQLCVIAPLPCGNDSQCPTVEECDLGLGECVARAPCLQDTDCPQDHECHDALGLCFAE